MTEWAWDRKVRLNEARGGLCLEMAPDVETRAGIARDLGLVALNRFEAQVRLEPWLDGVAIEADWTAVVTQTCGVSLEPFESPLADSFELKALPTDSRHRSAASPDVAVDIEADDPPDEIEGDTLDIAAYLVEQLALAIDPYPRKPGAVFDGDAYATPEPSPFAALARLKREP